MVPTGFETPFCAGLSSTRASRVAAWRCFSIFARFAIPTERRDFSDARRPHFMPSMSSHAGLEDAGDARPTGLHKRSITGPSGTRPAQNVRPSGGSRPDLSETRDSGFLFASLERAPRHPGPQTAASLPASELDPRQAVPTWSETWCWGSFPRDLSRKPTGSHFPRFHRRRSNAMISRLTRNASESGRTVWQKRRGCNPLFLRP